MDNFLGKHNLSELTLQKNLNASVTTEEIE